MGEQQRQPGKRSQTSDYSRYANWLLETLDTGDYSAELDSIQELTDRSEDYATPDVTNDNQYAFQRWTDTKMLRQLIYDVTREKQRRELLKSLNRFAFELVDFDEKSTLLQ